MDDGLMQLDSITRGIHHEVLDYLVFDFNRQ